MACASAFTPFFLGKFGQLRLRPVFSLSPFRSAIMTFMPKIDEGLGGGKADAGCAAGNDGGVFPALNAR